MNKEFNDFITEFVEDVTAEYRRLARGTLKSDVEGVLIMEAWEIKLNNRLDNIWAFWAARDYVMANYRNGKRRYKRDHPFCLTERTIEARETRLNGSESQKKAMVLSFFREFPQIDIDNKGDYCKYWINR